MKTKFVTARLLRCLLVALGLAIPAVGQGIPEVPPVPPPILVGCTDAKGNRVPCREESSSSSSGRSSSSESPSEKKVEFAVSYFNKGMKLYEQGTWLEAARCFLWATIDKPRVYRYHLMLGNTWLNLKDYNSAAASYRRAIALKPKEATAHWNLAVVLVKQKLYDEAHDEMRLAAKFDPKSLSYIEGLASLEDWLGKLAREKATHLKAGENSRPSPPRSVEALNRSIHDVSQSIEREKNALLKYQKLLEGLTDNINDFIAMDDSAWHDVRHSAARLVTSSILNGTLIKLEKAEQLLTTEKLVKLDRMIEDLVRLGKTAPRTRMSTNAVQEILVQSRTLRNTKESVEWLDRLLTVLDYGDDYKGDNPKWTRFWQMITTGIELFATDPRIAFLMAEGEFLSACLFANFAARIARKNLNRLADQTTADVARVNIHVAQMRILVAERRKLQEELRTLESQK